MGNQTKYTWPYHVSLYFRDRKSELRHSVQQCKNHCRALTLLATVCQQLCSFWISAPSSVTYMCDCTAVGLKCEFGC